MKFALIVCILTLIILCVSGLILSLLLITNSEAIAETLTSKLKCDSTGCPGMNIDMNYQRLHLRLKTINLIKK